MTEDPLEQENPALLETDARWSGECKSPVKKRGMMVACI